MRLTVGKKLALGFSCILVLMTVSALLSYFKLEKVQDEQSVMVDVRVPTLAAALVASDRIDYTGAKSRQAILAGNQTARKEAALKSFGDGWDAVGKQVEKMKELAPHWTLQENRDSFSRLVDGMQKGREAQEAAIQLASPGDRDAIVNAGNYYVDQATPALDSSTKALRELAESFEKQNEESKAEIESSTTAMEWTLIGSTVAALVVGVLIAVMLSHKISRSTSSVLMKAEAIASGDLTVEELKLLSEDEIGDLTKAINKMNDSLKHMIFAIHENAQQVAAASEEFSATSQQITANSEETTAQANTVSAATEQVSRSLQTVATGAEEMSATIKDIAKNASEAARVAGEAVRTAQATNTIVSKLGDSSAEIGQVIKVITSIAQQTNLLALNATIEAARAGEAGKGFAVVANEVKELAKQTAKATEEISQKIGAIQVDTKGAVEAIATISDVIHQINDISNTIATAVEEQSATTNEMTRNVTEAAKGSGAISDNISGVAQAAQSTSSTAHQTQKAASDLAEMSTRLRRLVDQFKVDGNGRADSHGMMGSRAA